MERLYTMKEASKLLGVHVYAQKDDLERQIEIIKAYAREKGWGY